MGFFLTGVGVGSGSGGANQEELDNLAQKVDSLNSKLDEKVAEIDRAVSQANSASQTAQNTLTEVERVKQQTEQNNALVQGFDERLTEYDTTTVKFIEV